MLLASIWPTITCKDRFPLFVALISLLTVFYRDTGNISYRYQYKKNSSEPPATTSQSSQHSSNQNTDDESNSHDSGDDSYGSSGLDYASGGAATDAGSDETSCYAG